MKNQIDDFRTLIDYWPTQAAFARDVLQNDDTSDTNPGRIWYRRNRVPFRLFPEVILACQKMGLISVDLELLKALFTRGYKEGSQAEKLAWARRTEKLNPKTKG